MRRWVYSVSMCAFIAHLVAGCPRPVAQPEEPTGAGSEARPLADAGPLKGVRASMWELARETGALRELLQRSSTPDAAELERMRAHLDTIGRVLASLDKPAGRGVHPLLGEKLPGFREDVLRARADLDRDPPALEGAAEVVGSCTRCHVVARAERGETWRLAARDFTDPAQ